MVGNDEQRLEDLYRSESGRVFGIAYRMLGSVTEAEEVVQDAFVRFEEVEPEAVRRPPALLATIATRLSIDRLKSARAEREEYVGAWLPEPLLVDDADVAGQAEQADSISMAFLVLLESLSPLEREVFLLREAFDYDYAAIGEIVEPAARRTVVRSPMRARRQVVVRAVLRFESSRAESARRSCGASSARPRRGDSEGPCLELLAADVGALRRRRRLRAPAFLGSPLDGRERIAAAALVALLRAGAQLGARLEPAWVNGSQPGARVLAPRGALINVVAVDVLDGQVQAIRSVVNPEKLGHLGPLADVKALLAGRRRA